MRNSTDTRLGRKASALIRDQLVGNDAEVVFNVNAMSDDELVETRRAMLKAASTIFDALAYRSVGKKLAVISGAILPVDGEEDGVTTLRSTGGGDRRESGDL